MSGKGWPSCLSGPTKAPTDTETDPRALQQAAGQGWNPESSCPLPRCGPCLRWGLPRLLPLKLCPAPLPRHGGRSPLFLRLLWLSPSPSQAVFLHGLAASASLSFPAGPWSRSCNLSAPVNLATKNFVTHTRTLGLWKEWAKDNLVLTCPVTTDPSLPLCPLGTRAASPVHR